MSTKSASNSCSVEEGAPGVIRLRKCLYAMKFKRTGKAAYSSPSYSSGSAEFVARPPNALAVHEARLALVLTTHQREHRSGRSGPSCPAAEAIRQGPVDRPARHKHAPEERRSPAMRCQDVPCRHHSRSELVVADYRPAAFPPDVAWNRNSTTSPSATRSGGR
jgi:hypothetical protein